jgi:hypothetical protein
VPLETAGWEWVNTGTVPLFAEANRGTVPVFTHVFIDAKTNFLPQFL